jgi:hypothetical protein
VVLISRAFCRSESFIKFRRSDFLVFDFLAFGLFQFFNFEFAKNCRALDRAARNRAHYLAIGRPAHGDTEGDTHGDTDGDSVSPSCIPHLGCKFKRKYKALADRPASGINPDLPLGAPPSGFPSFHLHAGIIFQQFCVPAQVAPHHHGFQPDVVASLGALLRWNTFFMAVQLCGCASRSGER